MTTSNNSLSLSESSVKSLQISERNGQQVISARELYNGLGITDRFNRWFESLKHYGFEENEDFTSVGHYTLVNNGAKREIGDYLISLDMAKQICMLQRSERGKAYRQYLINLEKVWNNPEMILKRALDYANTKAQQLYAECEELKPKAKVYDELVDRSKTMNFRDMAAKLGISQKDFMKELQSKYIYKNSIGEYRAYSEYQKYFSLRTYVSQGKTGEQLLLNMEGITYFVKKYKETVLENLPKEDRKNIAGSQAVLMKTMADIPQYQKENVVEALKQGTEALKETVISNYLWRAE